MKRPISIESKKELKSMALNIEFLLISVIQGMALQILAGYAVPLFGSLNTEYWPYAISAFSLILIFWSQSLIHALSFIDWPIDLIHTFLYFLASFVEVLTFSYITDPLRWFIGGFLFLIVSAILYIYDLIMIKRRRSEFTKSTAHQKLYTHVETEQKKELLFLLPAALLFNGAALGCIFFKENYFITQHYHVILGAIQMIFSVVTLVLCVRLFKTRIQLITDSYQ